MSEHGAGLRGDSSPEHDRYRLLLEITDVVARTQSLPEAFQEFAPPVLALTGGELLNLCLHDPRRDLMLTQYWKKDNESGVFDPLPVDGAASGWAWKHQKSVVIPDTKHEERFPDCVQMLFDHGVRSYNVIPLSTPSARFGAVGLGKSAPGEELSDEDLEFLRRVVMIGAIALQNEKASRISEEHKSLIAISSELSSTLELEKLLPRILQSLRSISRYDRAILTLLDEHGEYVQRYGDRLEWEAHLKQEGSVLVKHSLSAEAIATRAPFLFQRRRFERTRRSARQTHVPGRDSFDVYGAAACRQSGLGNTECERHDRKRFWTGGRRIPAASRQSDWRGAAECAGVSGNCRTQRSTGSGKTVFGI
jgi:GAF domain-containing protein